MSVSTIGGKTKENIAKDYTLHAKDVGSCEVQAAVLTARIKHLTKHLKKNKKDNHTRYGLLILVGRRRRLLKYLKKKKPETFLSLSKKLGLKAN